MRLFQAIFERWRADPRLTALVPGERVFTGKAAGDTSPPYAVITGQSAPATLHTTHTAVRQVRLELTAWIAEHAAGVTLLEELRRSLDRQSFAAGDEQCLLVQCEEERVLAEEQRGWRAEAVYRAWVERAESKV